MGDQGKLQGKLALVTGSGTGLGREVALAFAREGAHVAVHYATSAAGALSTVAEIEALGQRSTALQADLGQVQACFELVDRAAASTAPVEVAFDDTYREGHFGLWAYSNGQDVMFDNLVIDTEIDRNVNRFLQFGFGVLASLRGKSVEAGAATSCYVATR